MASESVVAVDPRARKILMPLACCGLFVYGVLVAFLGAAMPELRARFSFTVDHAGLLFSFLYLAQIMTAFMVGPLIDRYGTRIAILSGAVLCGAGFAGVGFAGSYRPLATAMLVLGAGGSLLSSASNTLVSNLYPKNPASALNIAHAIFALGAVFFPAALSLSEIRMGLARAIGITVLIATCIAFFALFLGFPSRHAEGHFNWREVRGIISPQLF